MEVQRIKYERTGGFTGMTLRAEIEPGDLPEDQAQALLELLDDMDFDELPTHLTGDPSTSDQFAYQITVQTKKGEHTVTTGEASAPEKMQELIRMLDGIARRRK